MTLCPYNACRLYRCMFCTMLPARVKLSFIVAPYLLGIAMFFQIRYHNHSMKIVRLPNCNHFINQANENKDEFE